MSYDILSGVIQLVSEHLGVDSDTVTPDADIAKDLGANSLDIVELIMALEEEFDLKYPKNEEYAHKSHGTGAYRFRHTVRGAVDASKSIGN